MWFACDTISGMTKTITIDVSDGLYRELEERAARYKMPLSEYLLNELENVGKPPLSEWLAKLAKDEPVQLSEPPDVIIRRYRDAADPRDLV